jgi:hypothetical protein
MFNPSKHMFNPPKHMFNPPKLMFNPPKHMFNPPKHSFNPNNIKPYLNHNTSLKVSANPDMPNPPLWQDNPFSEANP